MCLILPPRGHAPGFPPQSAVAAAILALGGLLAWLSAYRPTLLPSLGPWDFSWSEYLAFALSLLWWKRGLTQIPRAERPPLWRRAVFLLGMAALWAVLQTHFDYMAQHMFFLNRTQHVVMHHLGPFLVALGWPGPAVARGMPEALRRWAKNRAVRAALGVVQHPLPALVLFVGLFYFWLIPPIHFRAMLDARLYLIMNWSMVVDGLLFWALVLDPRPKPPARLSFGGRAALSFAVMFPQILLGSVITFARTDLYPFYDLCGRLYPSVSALEDQHIGGIISWIPPAMMSVAGVLVVLNALRLDEDRRAASRPEDAGTARMAALAERWTGR
ncbi:MAG: cytochrome c oxidase assembly protein [Stellaceae bacterium]